MKRLLLALALLLMVSLAVGCSKGPETPVSGITEYLSAVAAGDAREANRLSPATPVSDVVEERISAFGTAKPGKITGVEVVSRSAIEPMGQFGDTGKFYLYTCKVASESGQQWMIDVHVWRSGRRMSVGPAVLAE